MTGTTATLLACAIGTLTIFWKDLAEPATTLPHSAPSHTRHAREDIRPNFRQLLPSQITTAYFI